MRLSVERQHVMFTKSCLLYTSKLRISHSFVSLPDENWEDLTEVNSHPIALMQCREFLNQHPQLKVVEGEDTARSAEIIKNENLKGHAAICSKAAAERYGMKAVSYTHLKKCTTALPWY